MAIVNEGKKLDISRVAKARRRFIAEHLGGRDLKILEIGALDNPTFLQSEDGVFFADVFSQTESQLRHAKSNNRSAGRIVPVDFVLRDSTLRDAVTIRADLTIANHVIEHVPDVIRWLQDVRAVTASGGCLFLSVPDRRFTFDYFKPNSDAVDLVRAYDEKLVRPSKYQILRHLYYHADIDRFAAWEGRYPSDHLHRLPFPEAITRAKILSQNYTDVHCFFFTTESFKRVLDDLAETDLVPWTTIAIRDVGRNENEFRVLLRAI